MMLDQPPSQLSNKIPRWLLEAGLALAILVVSCAVSARSAEAQTLTVLYSFTGGADGSLPGTGVILDSAGDLYGVTGYGGKYTWGTVFKLDTIGNETVLYSFTGGSDGAYPDSAVTRDSFGNIYGTTGIGGNLTCNNGQGCGTVFRVAANGTETVLHRFVGSPDGQFPGSLLRDSAGNLYGVTAFGGGTSSNGTVFKLGGRPPKETILYRLGGGATSPSSPQGIIRDGQGNFYGTTLGGPGNFGTVFGLSAAGKGRVLYTFSGGADGGNPFGGVVLDSAGNLYGPTQSGGTTNFGVIFKVDQTGKETVLHRFTGSDGIYPMSGLTWDAAGNLYGCASQGGTYGGGTIFKLDPSGTVTTLHSFGGSDGEYPIGTLVFDSAGNLYGTTQKGGEHGWGTVFKLAP